MPRNEASIGQRLLVLAVQSSATLAERATPKTYDEAITSEDAPRWIEAMEKEYSDCEAQHTWTAVDRSSLPSNTNILRVKWVYKIKKDENGKIVKYKARITPKGFMQIYGVDYFEVFAQTGKYASLRLLFSIAAENDLEMQQYDVPQAFPRADLEEEVYMELPEGFEQLGKVLKLLRSLYGLKQAPRNWYLLISKFIIEVLGFQATISDPCLFYRYSKTGKLMLLFLFVDDMRGAYHRTDLGEWAELVEKLRQRFDITDLGDATLMLGMRVTRNRAARTITIDHERYITDALERFGLSRCKTANTPAVKNDGAQEDDRDGGSAPADLKLYQEKVGTLLYAAITTRPDIAYAVNKLTRHMTKPLRRHMVACDRVFRYLSGTLQLGLLFGRGNATDTKGQLSNPKLNAYADADWGNDRSDGISITGWISRYNEDLIDWSSKKQSVVAQSTCEAELYAGAAAMNELLYLDGMLTELGFKFSTPVLYGDNQSMIQVCENGIRSKRTKHVDIKYHYITDTIKQDKIKLEWVSTEDQLADIFTKALDLDQFRSLRDRLMTTVQK